jgi:predicted transcriptional regulator of viral defense system
MVESDSTIAYRGKHTLKDLRLPWTGTPVEFFAVHPVFRLDEFEAAYENMGRPSTDRSARSAAKILAWHVKEGRLFNVRRGLYARADEFDPWVLASKLADDVVISHDGALSFHRVTGLGHRLSFTTTSRTSRVVFDEVIYEPLRIKEPRIGGVLARKRSGQPLFVTSLEHTFVDCLALLERAPPPEELIVHFGQRVKSLDHRAMIEHAVDLESPIVVSRLAYFFICSRVDLDGPAKHLLETHGAQRPAYFVRTARTKQDRFIRRCNLIVPPTLERFWPGTG